MDDNTHIRAEQLVGDKDSGLVFSGEVEVRKGEQWIRADQVIVSGEPRRILATDDIQGGSTGVVIEAERAEFFGDSNRTLFEGVDYRLLSAHARGTAERIDQDGNILRLENALYTTCPDNNADWSLTSRTLKLDQDRDVGIARHTTLKLGKVPVIYLPWASFPLSGARKSGVLFPTLGTTDNGGFEMSLPVYWNIAPNYDATITPHWITSRGTAVENQFRFLNRKSKGVLEAHYLPNDKLLDQQRYLYDADIQSQLNPQWRLLLDGSYVSDNNYLQDFSNDLNLTSLSHLGRSARLLYDSSHTHLETSTLRYQTINSTIAEEDFPYAQLPRISLKSRWPLNNQRINLGLRAEATRFSHSLKQTGERYHFNPAISYHWRRPGFFVTPLASWHYTDYQLDENNGFAAETLERSLPTYSLDSGLFFERQTASGDIQTLEPRLYYLKTPYRDQSSLPVFDSTETSFNFYSMFRENRFNGIDRISDANQLTAALTTRRINTDSGQTPWSAAIGQIFYFEDRQVTLPGDAIETADTSDYATELAYTPEGPWSSRASLIINPSFNRAEAANWLTRYRGTNGKLANLEYRYRKDTIEQTNASFVLPVNQKWRVLGRWLHSLRDKRDVEILAGLEYETCCWKAQLVGRRYAETDNQQYNNSFYFQVVLKGLSSYGGAADLLHRSITGYNIDEY